MKIVGVERVDYTSKKTGKPVKGYRIHMTEEKEGMYGVCASNIFIGEKVGEIFLSEYANLEQALGEEVRVLYNQYGRVDGIERR